MILPPPKTLVVLDYETADNRGASVEFWRPDFRAISCAISWDGGSYYITGELSIELLLRHLVDYENPIVAHNISFEMGVTMARFPGITPLWYADTMRLAQIMDGGKLGLGLSSCIERFLPAEYHNHKEPYYQILRDVYKVKKGKEGAHLHLLDVKQLEAYNLADTDTTLALYNSLVLRFKTMRYDWEPDHQLYLNTAYLVTKARLEGIQVDRSKLSESRESLQADLKAMTQTFRDTFHTQITEIEQENLQKFVSLRKSEKGQANAWLAATETPSLIAFKTSSTDHKSRLFVDKLGITPKFKTSKGKPSFAKKLLRQWGDGGKLLIKRGTIFQALSQVKRLQEKSEFDGRWHVGLKVAGTVTGRMAGTDGLNIQAMARREERLMGCIVPDPGCIFVSVDLSAGEPSIITHFSKDSYYRAAIFDMVGKEPYYDDNGVLMIDDIYLMGMSISPMGAARLKDVFDNHQFDGLPFSQAWLVNSDAVKSYLAPERAFHKILILGIGYAMGPQKMALEAFRAGFELTNKEAKAFFLAYWGLIKDVKKLNDELVDIATKTGYLINPFGYRCVPDPLYKAMNYFIQSSINGLIAILCAKFFAVCEHAKFITIIHDEVIFQIPKDKTEEARALFDSAVESLNEDLGWSVKIRTGWKEGNNLYEAK